MTSYLLIALLGVAILSLFLACAGKQESGRAYRLAPFSPVLSWCLSGNSERSSWLILLSLWNALSGTINESFIRSEFADIFTRLDEPQTVAFFRDVKALAEAAREGSTNVIISSQGELKLLAERASEYLGELTARGNIILAIGIAALSLAGFGYGYTNISRRLRARHFVKRQLWRC